MAAVATGVPVSRRPYEVAPTLIDGDDLPTLINAALAFLFAVGVCIGWVGHSLYLAVTA